MTNDISPVLAAARSAAAEAFAEARKHLDRASLLADVGDGADGTPTKRLDVEVETAALAALEPFGVNVLSEEIGWVDRGSATTVVIDPVDGTGNAASGVPFSAFTAAIVHDDVFVEAITHWFETGREWWASLEHPVTTSTTGSTTLADTVISSIRPKRDPAGFLALSARCGRMRILGSTALEAALVADGALDAHVDPGSRTHRIVDLAAAVVLVEGAGGVVIDVHGNPVRFTTEVDTRWSGVVAATPQLADEILTILG